MRTRDIGRKVIDEMRESYRDQRDVLLMLLGEMEENYITLSDTEPKSDSFFAIRTNKGVKYAIRHPKKAWGLQRLQQTHRLGEVKTNVDAKSKKTNPRNLPQ